MGHCISLVQVYIVFGGKYTRESLPSVIYIRTALLLEANTAESFKQIPTVLQNRYYCEAPVFLHHCQSHWSSGSPFASRLWGSGSRPGDAPTLTVEPGSPVSDVSLHWWPWRDHWSLAMKGPLTLASGCFSHPSCPSSFLIAGHRLMRHTARIL